MLENLYILNIPIMELQIRTYVQRKFTASSAYIHFNQSDEVLCEFGLFVYEHLNRFDSKMAFLRA